MAKKAVNVMSGGGSAGWLYCLSFFGAAVYFVQRSEGFGEFIVALLKAAVWPAFVMHRVLELLAM